MAGNSSLRRMSVAMATPIGYSPPLEECYGGDGRTVNEPQKYGRALTRDDSVNPAKAGVGRRGSSTEPLPATGAWKEIRASVRRFVSSILARRNSLLLHSFRF